MPLYEYACCECDKHKELSRSISTRNDPLDCECGGAMKIAPTSSLFKINGYSFDNGYSGPEEIRYDGASKEW